MRLRTTAQVTNAEQSRWIVIAGELVANPHDRAKESSPHDGDIRQLGISASGFGPYCDLLKQISVGGRLDKSWGTAGREQSGEKDRLEVHSGRHGKGLAPGSG